MTVPLAYKDEALYEPMVCIMHDIARLLLRCTIAHRSNSY